MRIPREHNLSTDTEDAGAFRSPTIDSSKTRSAHSFGMRVRIGTSWHDRATTQINDLCPRTTHFPNHHGG
jgi:hypothetical protein